MGSKIMAETISHEGIVVRVDEGTRAMAVRVRIEQRAACAACKAKQMCSASETMVKEIDAQAVEPLQVGDRVTVHVQKKLGWKAVLIAFVVPFCILLLGVWALPHWIESEALVGTLAIAALAPYYALVHCFEGRFEQEYQFWATKE